MILMPSKIIQICPKCFSKRLFIGMKAGMYKDKQGFVQGTSLWGEIYHCADCKFVGEQIIEGNEKLFEYLQEVKKMKKARAEAKKEAVKAQIAEQKVEAPIEAKVPENIA